VPENLGDAAVLPRFRQLKRPIDCRCHAPRRYHDPAAETNAGFPPKADVCTLSFRLWTATRAR